LCLKGSIDCTGNDEGSNGGDEDRDIVGSIEAENTNDRTLED